MAIVGPTAADTRDVMVEGVSGILSCYPEHERPLYEPSKRRITWASGALATMYSADEPERLRGPAHDAAWCDELAAWRFPEAWDQLQFGLRLGTDPRCIITTTPKPVQIIKDLIAHDQTVVTRGSTYENKTNLASGFLTDIVRKYEGTRLGRQELEAELLEDVPGALWTQELIDRQRVHLKDVPPLVRVVVAIDPAVTASETSDETGIVAVGLAANGHIYPLEDASMKGSPGEWGRASVLVWCSHKGDRIVAEVNNGGDMVEANIRAIHPDIPYRSVRATRGKLTRAEPVAALYEQGRVHHVGFFPAMESQMCNWTPNSGDKSPDRLDALVWAIYELVLDPEPTGGIVTYEHPVLISRI